MKYLVTLEETRVEAAELEVEADSTQEAGEIALGRADDLDLWQATGRNSIRVTAEALEDEVDEPDFLDEPEVEVQLFD